MDKNIKHLNCIILDYSMHPASWLQAVMVSHAVIWLCLSLGTGVHLSGALPPQHRGWLRLWEEGEVCGECQKLTCPTPPPGCPAGLVQDTCGCCEQCANAEGQLCDPDGAQHFYGQCGEELQCQRSPRRKRRRKGGHGGGGGDDAGPEPKCVCRSRGPVCGSDGRTYPNPCQLREEASRTSQTELRMAGAGPCYSAPQISKAPRGVRNSTGSEAVFSCEVSAFPLPNVSWMKNGSHNFLPGDDPHISVQSRGGPQRFTVSTWLQIQGLHLSDGGTYLCMAYNTVGETSASARLHVLRTEAKKSDDEQDDHRDGSKEEEEDYFFDSTGDDEDELFISGDYSE